MSVDPETSPAAPPRKQSRGRGAAVWVVLVVAGLLLLLSSFAVWINRVALNTNQFADTSSSLLDDPAIRAAVANRAVDELFANVDVQAEVEGQRPVCLLDSRLEQGLEPRLLECAVDDLVRRLAQPRRRRP